MRSRSSRTQVLDLAPPPARSASCSSVEELPVSHSVSAGEVHSQTDLDSLMSSDFDSCSATEHLANTWICITRGEDQVIQQGVLRRNSFLSLSQRVQVNRRILQHLLINQRTHLDDSQSESREHNDTGFVLNDSEILLGDENHHSLFVSAAAAATELCEDRGRMKRRCVPLRADHNLLTPDTHTLSGVRLHPVIQVRSKGVASFSGHLSDSSSCESAVGSTRRRPPTASPTRRLRFEDETEMEAESRYLERQRRRPSQRGTGVLVSKPDLNLYVKAEAGPRGAGHVVERQQRGRTLAGGAGQCDCCGMVLGGGVNLNLRLHPPVPENRGRSLYKTEPIRETYIGSVTPGETSGEGSGAGRVANKQVMRRTNQVELNGNQATLPQATPTTDLPINPYAPDQLTTPAQPSCLALPMFKCPSSPSSPQSVRPNCTKSVQNLNQKQEEQGRPAAAKPHRELQSGPGLKERSPCVKEGGLYLGMKSSSSSSSGRSSETTVESQAPPTPDSSNYGQVRQPMRAELHSDDTSLPEHFISRDEYSRLSLRRLFSTVRLSRTRTGSLDRLSSRPRPSVSGPAPSDPAPSCPRKSSGLLKKTPSVQSLSVGSPFLQLKKSSSVQSFGSEQKKKKDRSADYRPAADQFLQRCLSTEDVGRPCSVRSVGRVLQVCSDGTFLLELSQPKSQMYGFIISRGRGRPDSGVYVEDMVDSSTEKLYAGLLAVGDEILEVNGEKVACLSLDQVTHLLTQNTSATVRVLRQRRTPPR
ncbi:uncharacterized protein LOC122878399 isoform X2 [Siniperca chuatsi]|uniref:uncharacterized protein LOC122878399 isoform X2 n=1 Tax=Siniperca chuatsi TaxID=119488 RepID=UPI001CE18F18|nr:uncharacterized protein LOC122878399 isoform X2 [Siniperca chuatsi]